jgi:hypothetical protein
MEYLSLVASCLFTRHEPRDSLDGKRTKIMNGPGHQRPSLPRGLRADPGGRLAIERVLSPRIDRVFAAAGIGAGLANLARGPARGKFIVTIG